MKADNHIQQDNTVMNDGGFVFLVDNTINIKAPLCSQLRLPAWSTRTRLALEKKRSRRIERPQTSKRPSGRPSWTLGDQDASRSPLSRVEVEALRLCECFECFQLSQKRSALKKKHSKT